MYRLIILAVALATASGRSLDNRIIGGKTVSIEEHPYQVILQTLPGASFCSGAIVTTQHVLTSGYCVLWRASPQVFVHYGSSHRISGGDVLDALHLTTHPKFTSQRLDYDVAVIKLMKAIVASAAAAPISLVPVGDKRRVGEMLTASGWGMTSAELGAPVSDVLQAIRIPVVDSKLCDNAHAKGPFRVTERMFCAGGAANQGTYLGDSGGPIINDKKQLVGVISWEHIGNITGYPGVYTDLTVPEITDFVEKNIK